MSLFSTKNVRWLKVLSKYISVQLVVQVLGFVSGVLLVRTLDQKQYSYYTIALSMQSTMHVLSDLGIGVSLSAIGGKVWQDRSRFGQLINTALQIRYYLAAISITVVTPIMIWMLIRNDASIGQIIFITFGVLISLNFDLTNVVLSVVLKMHSQINRIQNLDLFSAVLRLALLGVGYLSYIDASIAIFISAFVMGCQRFLLSYLVNDNIDQKAAINLEDKKFIINNVMTLYPNGIFFSIQGQISVWLIAVFGTTQNIANIGALARLSVIFALINPVIYNIIVPIFARCQKKEILFRRYFQIVGGVVIFASLTVVTASLFSHQILWVLGSTYGKLDKELLLVLSSGGVGLIANVMNSLNGAKAWISYVWVEIPMRIGLQIILLLVIDISSLEGVLWFGLISYLSPILMSTIITYFGMKNYEDCI